MKAMAKRFPVQTRRAPNQDYTVVRRDDVALIKGMLLRGDLQSDIAAFFGTNGGRVSEINTGQRHADVAPAPPESLPPKGPYLAGRSALRAVQTLEVLRDLIDGCIDEIRTWEARRDG